MFLKKMSNKVKIGPEWLLAFLLVFLFVGCNKGSEGIKKLASGKLEIPANGGSSTIVFEGQANDDVSIVLSANDMDCAPYGHLEDENGNSIYVPQNSSAKEGKNSGKTVLKSTGNYTLTLFDGSNRGCTVDVTVTALTK